MLPVALGIIVAIAVAAKAEPNCHLSKLIKCEEIALDTLNSLPKRSIPHTEEEIRESCQQTQKAMACAAKFRDSCMTPMQKELVKYLTEGVETQHAQFCNYETEVHKKYMEHADCLNDISQMEEVKTEMEYILAVMEKAERVGPTQRLVYYCCAYAKMYNSFRTLGIENCGKEAVDAIEDIISIGVAQLPEVVCSGFDGNDSECLAVLPPSGAKPSKNVQSPIIDLVKQKFKNWL